MTTILVVDLFALAKRSYINKHTCVSVESPGKRGRIHFLTKYCGIHLFSIRHQERKVGGHSYWSTRYALSVSICRLSPVCKAT